MAYPNRPVCKTINLDVSTPLFQPIDYNNLINKPTINGVPLEGNVDIPISQTYTYNQQVASDTWEITHNLGRYPSVTIVDSAGTVVIGEVTYIDTNTVSVGFNGIFSGTAYLN